MRVTLEPSLRSTAHSLPPAGSACCHPQHRNFSAGLSRAGAGEPKAKRSMRHGQSTHRAPLEWHQVPSSQGSAAGTGGSSACSDLCLLTHGVQDSLAPNGTCLIQCWSLLPAPRATDSTHRAAALGTLLPLYTAKMSSQAKRWM